jgi:hypothetical protein
MEQNKIPTIEIRSLIDLGGLKYRIYVDDTFQYQYSDFEQAKGMYELILSNINNPEFRVEKLITSNKQ